MAILRAYSPVLHFDDDDGTPLAGGWLCTYLAGTSTPVATYADSTGTLNDVQIELDGRGECEVWLDSSKKYKFVVLDRNKAHPIVKDNVSVPAGGGGGFSVDITSTDGTVTITPSAGAFDLSIQSSLDTKKDKQENSDTSSTATKTLTRLTQDTNGVVYPHFDNIDYTPANRNLALEYSPSETYPIIGTQRMHDGVLYRSKVEINTAEDWNPDHWEVTNVISEMNKVYGNLLNIDILSLITDWVDITNYIVYRNNFRPKYTSEYSTLTAEYSPSTNLVRFGGHRRVLVSSNSFAVKTWQTAVDIEHPSFYGFKVANIDDMPILYYGIVYSQGAQFYPGVDSNGTTNGIFCQIGSMNSASDVNNAGIAFKPVINDASSGYSNNKGVQFPDCVLKVKSRV